MANFKLTIEYDGTAYHGWQRQKNDRTIQGEIERALEIMTRQRVVVTGSGRTDAGVHALAQTASFRCDTHLTPGTFHKGLNALLDEDIVIRGCQAVPDDFHARFDAVGKVYCYHILNRPLPAAVGRLYHWHIRAPLDTAAMGKAAAHILGSHDFKAFEGTGSPRSHTIRRVCRAEWNTEGKGRLSFLIEADGFLRFMVRNIVGTLVEVGLGKRSAAGFGEILRGLDRSRAGATAPARGLFLVGVRYPDRSVRGFEDTAGGVDLEAL